MAVEIEATYPLAPLQEGLLFHSLTQSGGAYLNQLAFPIEGPFDEGAFVDAWKWLLARHAILRTAFSWKKQKRPLQSVLSRVSLPLEKLDWSGVDDSEQEGRLAEFLAADRMRGFDLARPPLLRLALIRFGPERVYIVKTHHHLILDGWSSAILRRELVEAYLAFASGGPPELPAAGNYEDFISWVRRQDLAAAELFWRQELSDYEAAAELRTPRPEAGAGLAHAEVALDPARVDGLSALARAAGVTLNTVVQAAWAIVLARTQASSDVVFGTTVSGRPTELPGVENTVGLFINTLPVRVRLNPRASLADWLRDLQSHAVRARSFEYAPLARVQAWAGHGGGRALFDTLVVFENYPGQAVALSGESPRRETSVIRNQSTHYPLTLIVLPREGLRMEFAYDAAVLDQTSVQGFGLLLARVIEDMVSEGEATVGTVLAGRSGAGGVQMCGPVCEVEENSVPQAFRAQVRRSPHAPAIRAPYGLWTYAELDAASDRVAHGLLARGLGPEDRVGVSMQRSDRALVALLGILKCGSAYVPLDPDYPAARLELMEHEGGVTHVVTGEASAAKLRDDATWIDELLASEVAPGAKLPTIEPEQLAYVLFTSGSTGTPKPVGISHRAILALVFAAGYASLDERTMVGHASTLSFDAATFEIWGPLLRGGALRPIAKEDLLEPTRLAGIFRQDGVETLFLTTALFQHYARSRPEIFDGFSQVLFGGERVDPAVIRELYGHRPGTWMRHVYGPTETTTFATCEVVDEAALGSWTIPIGAPIGNTEALILDGFAAAVPEGVVGELYLGGPGLARGYLGRAGDTAAAFVPHPYRAGARLYRTGDLVRCNEEGRIEFVGRVDGQVKIRGFRIEPMELEAAIRADQQVEEAAVIVEGDGADRRLVAFVVPAGSELDLAELQKSLSERLPAHMLPARLEALESMPLGPTGKIDRRQLAEYAPGLASARRGAVPRNRLEQIIADIWCEMLGRDSVGVDEDFFDLGGHSILAVQVAERIRAAIGGEHDVPLTAIFQARRISELAALHAGNASAVSPVVPLRTGKRGAPLFCFHPAGGHVTGYRRLAGLLPRGITVLGVQSRALLDPKQKAESIDAMAADYVDAIHSVQPTGPYRLLGWSMGGVTALAVAERLEAAGESVDFVALVDTSLSVARGADDDAPSLVDRYASQLGAHPEHEALISLSDSDRATLEAELAAIDSDEERLAAALAFAHDHGFLSRNVSFDILRVRAAALDHAAGLVNAHRARPVKAALHVWCARRSEQGAAASFDWAALTSGPTRVRVLDENHATIVESRNLASDLGRILLEPPVS